MRRRRGAVGVVTLLACLVLASCTTVSTTPSAEDTVGDEPVATRSFPPRPAVPTGPLAADAAAAVDEIAAQVTTFVPVDTIRAAAASDDPRVLWPLADLLRFTQGRPEGDLVLDLAEDLTGVHIDASEGGGWTRLVDHLLAWDLPAPPGYAAFKGRFYTQLEPTWAPFFDDPAAAVDWRLVGWGGVLADTRPLGDPDRCPASCIPALDDPAVTDAAGGDWYGDDEIVFAVALGGEARAYPRHVMEVHELVNDTVGGVRLGIPYCTLCGAAQAYVTEGVPGTSRPLVLRTSGLLNRSNKMMFDLDSGSLVDTFTGRAVAGPLREAGVALEPVTVVTTTWGEWKAAHPDTTIVAEDGGIGRTYDRDPLGGRDDDGPIFPVGAIDPRAPAQLAVVGVVTDDGAVAFPADAARAALRQGRAVAVGDVELHLDGGGLRARVAGADAPANEAFWFAWSQFHPATALWSGEA